MLSGILKLVIEGCFCGFDSITDWPAALLSAKSNKIHSFLKSKKILFRNSFLDRDLTVDSIIITFKIGITAISGQINEIS